MPLNKNPDGTLDVSELVNLNMTLATGSSWRRFIGANGHVLVEPTNHPIDHHPDLSGDTQLLQLMSASGELYEANKWLLQAVTSLLQGKPVKNLDEIVLFAEMALKKAEKEV